MSQKRPLSIFKTLNAAQTQIGHDYTLTHISLHACQYKNAFVNRLTLCNLHYVETNTVTVLLFTRAT